MNTRRPYAVVLAADDRALGRVAWLATRAHAVLLCDDLPRMRAAGVPNAP